MATLNKKYQRAVADTTVKYDPTTGKAILPNDTYTLYCCRSRLMCCGIDELSVHQLLSVWRNSPKYAAIVLAKLIDFGTRDNRLIIIGIPVKVGANSQYDVKFYAWVEKTLLSFGFQHLVNKPYKNKNSNNMITVLAGQLP